MKKIQALQIIILLIISGLIGFYFGVNKVNLSWKNYKPSLKILNKESPSRFASADFSLFWTVWQRLESNYYDKTKLDPQKMVNGAIDGMVGSLEDPFTLYLPPVQNTNFKQGLAGQFSGIGAELGTKDKQIIVIAPLDQSPAQKGGIRAGDTILNVNGESISGWSIASAVEKIRGPKGTPVRLTILHKDSDHSDDITIVRDTITVKSVAGSIKNIKSPVKRGQEKSSQKIEITEEVCDECQKFAYIRLSQFGDGTNQDWLAVVNKLSLDVHSAKNIKGIVFDLRNNPGGYLTDAVFIVSEFLKVGTVAVKEDRGEKVKELLVSRKGLFYDIPLIVLINKGSASASEIVAGALQDFKRAKLIGETSFGKGTIQEAEDLGVNGAGLHVTIAKWLTPKGAWVNGKGLTPDIQVSLDAKDPARDTQLEKAAEELIK